MPITAQWWCLFSKRARESAPYPADFYIIGKDTPNRFGQSLGSNISEDPRFSFYFGCVVEVAVEVWNSIVHFSILPDQGEILQLLWAFSLWCVTHLKKLHAQLQEGIQRQLTLRTSKIHLAVHQGNCQREALCCKWYIIVLIFIQFYLSLEPFRIYYRTGTSKISAMTAYSVLMGWIFKSLREAKNGIHSIQKVRCQVRGCPVNFR